MKFKIILLIFINFILLINSQLSPPSSSVVVQELLYGNNTLIFYGYPSSSSSQICSFNIPFLFTSNNNMSIPETSNIYNSDITYISSDYKEILIQFSGNQSIAPALVNFTFFSNEISYIFEFLLSCQSYDLYNLDYKIIDSGIFYNSLAFQIQFNQSLTNLQFDFSISTTFNQFYIRNNTYIFLFDYNDPSFFINNTNNNINLGINFYSLEDSKIVSYPILIKNPFIPSKTQSLSKVYFDINHQVSYLEVSYPNSFENYFYTATGINLRFTEPYLIKSQNNNFIYLSPLYINKLLTTEFIIYNYINPNSIEIIFQNNIAQKEIQIVQPSQIIPLLFKENIYLVEYVLNSQLYSQYRLKIGLGQESFGYPFGVRGNKTNLSMVIPIYVEMSIPSQYTISSSFNGYTANIPISSSQTPIPISLPKLTSYDIISIPKGKMILFFKFENIISLNTIEIYDSPNSIYKSYFLNELVQDTDIKITTSLTIDRIHIYKISLISNDAQTNDYYVGINYKYQLNGQFQSLKSIEEIEKIPPELNYSINNIRFLFNDLQVTNNKISNKMFIKFNNFFEDRDLKVTFLFSDYKVNLRNVTVYSNFDAVNKEYEFEFNIPMNIKTGYVNYIISLNSLETINYYSYSLPSSYQLNISESNNIDLFGPIVTNLGITTPTIGQVNYKFEIEDSGNGFKKGYIIVRGENDLTERNISITLADLYGGTVYKGVYSINYYYHSQCVLQFVQIVYAYFEDNEGYWTEYDVNQINNKNPFYPILSSFNPKIMPGCNDLPTFNNNSYGSSIYPQLVLFNVPSNINLGFKESTRTAYFNYTAYHPDGISTYSLPKVYLSTLNTKYITSSETIVTNVNGSYVSFSSKVILPYISKFNSAISVYGIVSKAGTNGGFTPKDIDKGNFKTFSFSNPAYTPGPYITGSSKLSSNGVGGLWVYGNFLDIADYFKVQYTDSNNGYNLIKYSSSYSTAVFFPIIKPTKKPINIIASYLDVEGDPITIYPEIFNYEFNSSFVLCKGSPLCGGPSQGLCFSSGCKCISPWIGDDCMSKVIIVSPPKINETAPQTNITTGGQLSFESIISIVGIRELDVHSNLINEHYFDKWEYKLLLNNSYLQQYQYHSFIKKNNINVSNITVTIDWFKVESTIEFANQIIDLNPSTVKYTILISNGYPFASKLNTLQLLIKASMESNNGNSSICINNQFIESNSNSNKENDDYLKLNIDNHSFYGRFIKRCIIDNDIIASLSNSLLNNNIDKSISQSLIGINIPSFQDSVLFDPDFSIILNPYSTNCDDSGLSKTQLIGIIVGSVCFFIVILAIIAIIIYKTPRCIPLKIFFYKLFKKSKL